MVQQNELYDVRSDPDYQSPYIDVDEWRERGLPDGTKIPYRYVHGGFPNKNVKFSFCYPQKEAFLGRFYQYLSPFPGPDEELASLGHTGVDDKIAFCLAHGAYFVESNMGSSAVFSGPAEPKLVMKASSAVAEFSRKLAMEFYGCKRPYGYVYGGSGGSYKTFSCIENSVSWDGAVPYVIGSPVSLPNTIALHAQGQRALRNCFGRIVDALDAGGSGDPYEGLSEDEQRMLKEITQMGFPPRAWFLEAMGNINDGSLPVLEPMIQAMDPAYFEDFWTVEGYEGADPKSGAARDRLQFEGVVQAVHLPGPAEDAAAVDSRNGVDTAWQKMLASANGGAILLVEAPTGKLYLKGCKIHIESGEAAGQTLLLESIQDNCLLLGACYGMDDVSDVLSRIEAGDRLRLDNSNYIAIQSYYRHQVPDDPAFHAWDQFRSPDGTPTIPQRRLLPGSLMTGTGGTVQHGNFQGKVIVLCALMDESSCPWCGDWYRQTVRRAKGTEKDFRLYYMDNCLHGDESGLGNSRTVNYAGALRQALLDVADWAERGIEPAATTKYEIQDNQVILPDTAAERGGIQAVVTLLANGSSCARVKAGEPVRLSVRVEVPKDCGCVTSVAFSFEDSREPIDPDAFCEQGIYSLTASGCTTAETVHIYSNPGTYFASARITASREADDPFTQIQNLGRVRIIVEP